MKRLTVLLSVMFLSAGCATRAPEPGKLVAEERFNALVVPGRTTRAELLDTLGPTKSVVFDSGMEAWLYEAGPGPGRYTELVLLLDRDGVVRKVRSRPPYPGDSQR